MGWFSKLKELTSSLVSSEVVKRQGVSNRVKRILKPEYYSLLKKLNLQRDKYGWVLSDCDAMLWQGLYGACTKEITPIFYASSVKGKFTRRPGKECFKAKESRSSWSRDMAVGFLWWCFRAKNTRALDEHFSYGQRHAWKMGEGVMSRIYYTPQLASLLDQVRFHVKGRKYPRYKKVPYLFPKGLVDYQAHLSVLVILLYGEMYGEIPKEAFERLKEHYKRSKRNPLYAAAMLKYGGSEYSASALIACTSPVFDSSVRSGSQQVSEDAERAFAISIILQ